MLLLVAFVFFKISFFGILVSMFLFLPNAQASSSYRIDRGVFVGRYSWNFCETIFWKVNLNGFSSDEVKLWRRAFGKYEKRFGFDFKFAGFTNRLALVDYIAASFVPTVYVGYAKPGYSPRRSPVFKYYPSFYAAADFEYPLVGSQVTLGEVGVNVRRLGSLSSSRRVGTYMHELGHVFGLLHVADRKQIMSNSLSVPRFGSGDVAGIRRVAFRAGFGGCGF